MNKIAFLVLVIIAIIIFIAFVVYNLVDLLLTDSDQGKYRKIPTVLSVECINGMLKISLANDGYLNITKNDITIFLTNSTGYKKINMTYDPALPIRPRGITVATYSESPPLNGTQTILVLSISTSSKQTVIC